MKFAFYKAPGSIFDRFIRFWMRGPYAHVEAILEEHADGTFTIASSVPGIGIRIAAGQVLPASDWDIVSGPGNAAAAREWFEQRNGAPYDYIGLLGFVLRPAFSDDRTKFFCSEACLSSIGYQEAYKVDPNQMADILRFAGRTEPSSFPPGSRAGS